MTPPKGSDASALGSHFSHLAVDTEGQARWGPGTGGGAPSSYRRPPSAKPVPSAPSAPQPPAQPPGLSAHPAPPAPAARTQPSAAAAVSASDRPLDCAAGAAAAAVVPVSVSDPEHVSLARRDAVLRAYVIDRSWGLAQEDELRRTFLLNLTDNFPFKIVYDLEWYVSPTGQAQYGRGDMIMTDGRENYIVIEFKYIDTENSGTTHQARRTGKRKGVKDQAKKYAEIFRKQNPTALSVHALAVTNEMSWREASWKGLSGQ